MRKVISGKIYDTETAEKICDTESIQASGLRNAETSLYRTKNGAFFLAGEGGPASQWRQPGFEERTWISGEGMRVISADDARLLVEVHCDEAAYTRIFGEPEEG